MSDVVRLSLPAKPEYLVSARLVAGSMAGTAGFNMEEIEDVKTAVSEACLLLMPCMERDECLRLELWLENGLFARVLAHCSPEGCPSTPEREFSKFLLSALSDRMEFHYREGESEYQLYKALPD